MDDENTTSHEQGVLPPVDLNPRREPALEFPDKPLSGMTFADYQAIGFMAGLEVHQQLKTTSKLFCRCAAGRHSTRVDAEVLRHMRPTLSELGEYDGTALMEFKTRKEIVYLLDRRSVCTYEMDDTPPFEIDEEAVRIAVELAELCNLNLVSELHVMRKQYLDGSIPTGFQRTTMVGLTGAIPFRVPELGVDRELSIRQLSLEEDSCREVSDEGHRITFRTDRLGMPLTELVTEPEFRTPWELQAGGRLLAGVARATGKVLRGPGAARQDVNVSVAGGRRVEIKGVHHHRGLPLLVHTEAFRQLNLLRVKARLEGRGVTLEDLAIEDGGPLAPAPWHTTALAADAGAVLAHSNYQPIHDALHRGEMVVAVRLPGFGGLLTHPTQPGITFAREIADRVRVIACPSHRPFLTHSDLEDSGIGGREMAELRKLLKADPDDAIVVLWASEAEASTGAREILLRARDALVGIPSETRQAFKDGTTGFERILPGPDRMYPDTDTPPLPIPDIMVAEIRDRMPETPWARAERYQEMGLDRRTAGVLAAAPWADLFDELAPADGAPARRLATVLEKRLPFHLRRARGSKGRLPEEMPSASDLDPAVRALETGALRPEALVRVVDEILADLRVAGGEERPRTGASAKDVLERYAPAADAEEELLAVVQEVVSRARAMEGRNPETLFRWGMGEAMGRLLGRVGPDRVREALAAALAPGESRARGSGEVPDAARKKMAS